MALWKRNMRKSQIANVCLKELEKEGSILHNSFYASDNGEGLGIQVDYLERIQATEFIKKSKPNNHDDHDLLE